MKKHFFYLSNLLLVLIMFTAAGCSSAPQTVLNQTLTKQVSSSDGTDTIKAGRFDTGTMWTFEYAPVDYFRQEYNFNPTQEWFDHLRMSALRFSSYCSASFVSADGLVMTNDHCGRESITAVSGNDSLQDKGFFAATLQDERRVPELYVEQLVKIQDVTMEVQSAVDKASDQDKSKIEKQTMAAIEKRETEKSGLHAKVTRLYNGGKYSLYYYQRYNDVRLVFAPETQAAFFGGDPDNFTYPRYNLDCNFFRVYDDSGKPLKTTDYLKWSDKGALEGEPVFVIGNPGTTNRLNTMAQLEFQRDIQYPRTLMMINGLIDAYREMLKTNPPDAEKIQNELFSFTNSQKVYIGILKGLKDPVLMAKKRDFEKTFKARVQSNPDLNAKYGTLWTKIEEIRNELRTFSNELSALSRNPFSTPEYIFVAQDVVDAATQLKLPENERDEAFVGSELDSSLNSIYPEDTNSQMQKVMLVSYVNRLYELLGENYPLLKKMTGGRRGQEAVDYMLSKSLLKNKENVLNLLKKDPDALLNSDDPFIYFVKNSEDRRTELQTRQAKLSQMENAYSQNLGRALFEVYGTSIPPDATFTLRISDGVVEGFPYNGTIAPPVTTFYGMYDKAYGFGNKEPFNLPERWKNPPADFKLETPFNFVSTNDIIGGNSGSPVVNIKGEVVGLAFDGNIQSLPGSFIFTTEENRTVSVHSEGMVEAIHYIYKAGRLSEELRTGHIPVK